MAQTVIHAMNTNITSRIAVCSPRLRSRLIRWYRTSRGAVLAAEVVVVVAKVTAKATVAATTAVAGL